MLRQFTATVYITKDERVLLHKHPKHKKWLPPGGHVETNELPHEAAIREALEETGLDIAITSQENIELDASHAKSLPRPYSILLENIPLHKGVAAHQHIDCIYLAYLKGSNSSPIEPFQWLSYEETLQIPDEEMFSDTRLILERILKNSVIMQ